MLPTNSSREIFIHVLLPMYMYFSFHAFTSLQRAAVGFSQEAVPGAVGRLVLAKAHGRLAVLACCVEACHISSGLHDGSTVPRCHHHRRVVTTCVYRHCSPGTRTGGHAWRHLPREHAQSASQGSAPPQGAKWQGAGSWVVGGFSLSSAKLKLEISAQP